MVSKKGEGVRGVLGDLLSRDRERKENPPEVAQAAVPSEETEYEKSSRHVHPGEAIPPAKRTQDQLASSKKVGGIKGRPRARKDEEAVPRGERTKVTLSIDEELREQFYRLAHKEIIQPGEYVERALRFYIESHRK